MIYLDNNATTLIDARVALRMSDLMKQRLANPSSQHASGRDARRVLEAARDQVLVACGARTQGMECDQCIFTSGGTEANNLAIFGLAALRPGTIVVSSIEHPSVLAAVEHLERSGRRIVRLKCSPSGIVDSERFSEVLDRESPVALVSLMLANNETGVIQPLQELVQECRQRGIAIHTDAVQGLGKIPLNFADLQLDAMTVTAHKLHGPLGIGALLLRRGVQIAPTQFGGFQQLGIRPGTEMPVLAAGFAEALRWCLAERESRHARMQALRDRLEHELIERLPMALVLGADVPRLPHTSSIAFPGCDRQALQMALDHAGIACSTGSACASGSSQPSHVLQAMGLPEDWIRSALRFSLSFETTSDEIQAAIDAVTRGVQRLSRIPS